MSDVTYSSAENISRVLIVPHAVFSVLATVLVGMRLYVTRIVAKSPWTFDEYVAIVALIANHIMLITEGISVEYGLGTDVNQIVDLYPGGVAAFLKCILVLEIQYAIACPLSKMAVLAMFYRIFSASKMLRYSIWAITAMLVGWCIAVIMVSIPNIIFDILTVVLPIREVWALQMGREKKLAISGVFLLGGSVVLASVARLILFAIYRPGQGTTGNNISQTVIIPHAASAVETCLAIIGACLPPCAPLFRRWLGGVVSVVSSGERYGSRSARKKGPDGQGKSSASKNFNTLVTIGKISNRGGHMKRSKEQDDLDGSFERLEDSNSLQGSTDGLYVNGNGAAKIEGGIQSENGIHVQRDVCVERSGKVTSRDVKDWVVGDIQLDDMPAQGASS
ncbi:hypothetical protein CNYM01_11650 [Colletotrichum nymphaeae SA-01]|uniref:Rhodopsin domain-containing protein n=1 Tax=Colletotrichum nymphaeae SA-01 TaxID=1460502 RepID=A0A135T349_9PEZI|nr:hypothetical protein CNYM01_11650 [Colletotrichum nymphaeae SA-01]